MVRTEASTDVEEAEAEVHGGGEDGYPGGGIFTADSPRESD